MTSIKNQIAFFEDEVIDLEDTYMETEKNIQAVRNQLLTKENQLSFIAEETS